MTDDRLIDACLAEFQGTPEEFGIVLYYATFVPIELTEENRTRAKINQMAILELPHGRQLLEAEFQLTGGRYL